MSIEEIELFQKKEDADVYLVHWIIGENLTCILPFFDFDDDIDDIALISK